MSSNKRIVLLCNAMLLLATAIWGSGYVVQKNIADYIGPFTLMAIRYFLGTSVILPFVLFLNDRKPAEEKIKYNKSSFLALLKLAAFLAIIQTASTVLIQYGIMYTTASKASFLTATYIVLVPILSYLIFRQKTSTNTWIGVFIGLFGLYNLSVTEAFTIDTGDLFVIVGAAFCAVHILLISKYVRQINGMHLICAEFSCASLYCTIAAFAIEAPTFEMIWICKEELLYAGVLATGICYMIQVTAQKYTDPTVAALLMSLESLFGAIAGVIFLNESFTVKEIIGAFFLSVSVVIAQLKSGTENDKTTELPEEQQL